MEPRAPAPLPVETLPQILSKRGAERLDAIVATSDPFAIVAAMSKAEVFFSFAELDDELGRRILVRLLTDEQVDYLLDLELWQGDELDETRALEWVDRLLGAGDERAVCWALRARSELIVTILHKLVDVFEGPVASEMALSEAQDQLPPFTLEGQYYIHFRSREASQPLRRLLTLLAGEDLEYFIGIMQQVLGVMPSEAEEDSLRQRWRRLEDEGLEAPEDAYSIYRWPTQDELAALSRPAAARASDEDGARRSGAPTALAIGQPPSALAGALARLASAAEVDRVTLALASTSTLVLSADHLPLFELAAHARALSKTLGYVNIALERASGGEAERAAELLAVTSVKTLFRMGYGAVAELGRRATVLRRKGWLSQVGLGLEVLDSPIGETVAALARPRPVYPACLSGEPADREFRDLAEVRAAAEVLDRAEALATLFVDGLGLPLAPAEAFDLQGCYPSSTAELTLGLVLRTALARMALDDQLRFQPVEASRLAELGDRLPGGRGARPELRGAALALLRERLDGPEEETFAHVEAFLDRCLDELVMAFEGLAPGAPVDPRFVGGVVVRVG